MIKKFSYPKEKIHVLLLENVDEVAKKTFVEEGYKVETISSSLNEKELISATNILKEALIQYSN